MSFISTSFFSTKAFLNLILDMKLEQLIKIKKKVNENSYI